MKRFSAKNFLYLFALFIISSVVFGFYMFLAAQNHFPAIEPFVYWTAPRPFVYRVLTPFIIRILIDGFNVPLQIGSMLVMYLSLLGFSWTILALAKNFIPQKYAFPLTLIAPIGLIPLLIEQRHIYDFPTLFLFTLAIYFLAVEDFGKYLCTFFLLTFSKETSLFLILFYVIQFWKINKKDLFIRIIIQGAIYVLIRLVLIILFLNNPGSLMEFHLHDHLNAYLQQPLIAIILFIVIISVILLVGVQNDDETKFARNLFFATGGPTLLLYFFFGVPFEVRIFMETYPSIFLLISLVIARWMIGKKGLRENPVR